jgi:WD40 repeat protein
MIPRTRELAVLVPASTALLGPNDSPTAALPPPATAEREVRTLTGHSGTVRVLYSPAGTLATFSDDRTIRLWDRDGRDFRRLDGHKGLVVSASFSPDGKTLGTADGEAFHLWDVATGKALPAPGDALAGVARLTFAPDGKTLGCAGDRGEVRLWDLAAGKVTRTFSADHPKDVPVVVSALAYSPDGKTLAQAYTDGHPGPSYVRLWDAETGKPLRTLIDGAKSDVWTAVFSPDGKLLAAGDAAGRVRVFETKTWKEVAVLDGEDQLRSAAFAPDGRTLALGMRRDVQLWDATTGKRLRTLRGHANWVLSVSFSADGKTLASGSSDKTARLWPVE